LPKEWDELVPPLHFLTREQIEITEQSALPDLSYTYAIAFAGGKAIGVAYLQLLSVSEKHIDTQQLSLPQKFAWQAIRTIARPKLLVAGHLFRHDICSYYWDESIDVYNAFILYREIIETALRQTHAHAVLIKDMPTQLGTYFQHHAPEFLLLRNDISMELNIPVSWNDISDYEKALKHKYAQRYRKVTQAFKGVEIKELTAQQVEINKKEIYELYLQVSNKQKVRLGLISEDFLPLLKKQHENMLKVWGIYQEGKMIGFLSAWVKEHVFDMFYIGFDYNRNADLQLYFNILFYSIEQAIKHRKKKLILGRTALDAKARLGCKPNYLNTFLYIRNKLVRNRILLYQHNTSVQEGAWEERHPFKPTAVASN
jgi:hypothetical protein